MPTDGSTLANRTLRVAFDAPGAGPGPWEVKVLATDGKLALLTLPYSGGKVAVLNAGTRVTLTPPPAAGRGPDPPAGHVATVLERRLKPVPSVIVRLPAGFSEALGAVDRAARVVVVASGKGGVGKSVVAVNLAVALARQRQEVVLVDGDLGTANVDVLLGIQPEATLAHVVAGERDLMDVVRGTPYGFRVVPGGSGLPEVANLTEWQFGRLLAGFSALEAHADVIIMDTGAGIGRNVTNFFLAADDVMVVTTPEPPALVDAYALIKTAARGGRRHGIKLVLNRVSGPDEARAAAARVGEAARRFLGLDLPLAGWITEDPAVGHSVRRQTPVVWGYPQAAASRAFARLAVEVAGDGQRPPAAAGKSFVERLRSLFRAG